ncbi:MAG: molecular chaperone DnaJ [Candidatus Nealsonbacteria bacterium]
MAKDFYQILGVEKTASPEDIRKAYHKLAHQHHPDKGGDESKFKEVNEAYQTLSNKDKRAQYDQFGRVFEGGQAPGGAGGWDFGFGQGFGGQQGFDSADLGDLFGEMFGFGGRGRKQNVKKGKDIEVDLELPLEAVLKTQEKEFSLYKEVVCVRCHGKGAEPNTPLNECFTCRGTGEVQQIAKTIFGSVTRLAVCPECSGEGQRPSKPCNVCRGEGRIKSEEKIKIFIPAGVDTNQVIKVEDKGEAGRKGGKSGDLYIRIFIKKHATFQRKGDDLIINIPLSFSQAALGGEIEISTLDGKGILLKIPSGTESGKVLRISNKGIPHFSGYGQGSLYVKLIVKTPQKLSKKQKELLEELKKEGI